MLLTIRNKAVTYLEGLKGDGRSAKAKRNIIYSFALKCFSILISIGYVPLFLKILDQERYGVWLTFLTIINWFAFFDIGLGNGLRNKLAQALATDDTELCKKYISTTYAVLGLIFGGLSIVFLIANKFINWNSILNTTKISAPELLSLTNAVFIFFCARFVVQIIQVVYFAIQRPSVNNLIDTLGAFLAFMVLVVLNYFHYKVSLVQTGIIVSAIPVLLFVILSLITFFGSYPQLKPSFKHIDFSLCGSLMGIGGKFFIMQVTAIIIFSTSNVFITQFYGPLEVARFNICFRLFQVPIMVNSIILSPIWSAVTDAYTKQDYAWLKNTLKKLNLTSLLFTVGIVFMAALTPWVVKIWVKGQIVMPYSIAIAMAVYAIINVFQAPFSQYINGLGKLRLTTSLCVVGILVYLAAVFTLPKFVNNSSSIIIAITLTSLIGLGIQSVQSYKIINRKATGIWDK